MASDRAARCVGCGERLGATHRPACVEDVGEVIVANTVPAIVARDPGPDRPPLDELEPTAAYGDG